MKKNKYTYHLYLLLFWSLLSSIPSQAQTTRTLNFDCTCPGTSVSFDPESVVLCEGGSIDLSTILNIDPNNPKNIEWLYEGTMQSSGTATAPGRYTINVEDQTGCITKKSIEVLDPEDYFKDNCFIAIPIDGHSLSGVGGSGLNNQVANSRSSMETLTITMGDRVDVNLTDILGDLSTQPISISDDCSHLGEHLADTENPSGIIAHVQQTDDGPMLYLGSNSSEGNTEIVDQYLDYWNPEGTGSVLSAPIMYTCSDQFFETAEFEEWSSLFALLFNCENLDPKDENGFIPKCLWECYAGGSTAIPFTAGMIDAGAEEYAMIEDLINGTLKNTELLLVYAACVAIGSGEDFYDQLEKELKAQNLSETIVDEKIAEIEGLAAGTLDCRNKSTAIKEVKAQVTAMIDGIKNLGVEDVIQGVETAKDAVIKYVGELTACGEGTTPEEQLKMCNNAYFEQGKLFFSFASSILGGLVGKAAFRYLDELFGNLTFAQRKQLELFMKDDLRSGLPKDVQDKIAKDPDLFEAWNKLRKLGTCNAYRGSISTSRSSLTKCEELLKKVFTDVDAKTIKVFEKDTKLNPDLFDELANDHNLLEPWKALSGLSDGKFWVRTNVDLLKRMRDSPSYDPKDIANFYNKSIRRACKPLPCDFDTPGGTVHFNELGFPDLRMFSIGGPKYYFKDNVQGNHSTDFTNATNWLKEQSGIKKVEGSGSPVEVELQDGTKGQITWHHHEDGKTLMPVFSNVHTSALRHTGGSSIVSNSLVGFFDSP